MILPSARAAVARSEEGCLESLKLQSLVVTRVFLLWIRVCSRDCRERRKRQKKKKKEERKEGGKERSPLTFCTNFTPLSRCHRRRRRSDADDAFLHVHVHTTFCREKKLPVARLPIKPLGRLRECGYGRQSGKSRTGNADFPIPKRSQVRD